jgi:predicted RNase H-like HicB family nuclease
MKERRYFLRVVVRATPDLPGQWVAHCLDFDVVTQGNDPTHAFAMMQEAASMFALHELNAGRDPAACAAPDEDWQELNRLVSRSHPLAGELTADPKHVYIGTLPMRLVQRSDLRPSAPPKMGLAKTQVPATMQAASL